MEDQYQRTRMFFGEDALGVMQKKNVLIFGIGGVGGHCVEALARTGIRTIGIVDDDTVDITNLNRQIIALHTTLGRRKTEVMEERICDIDPNISVRSYCFRVTPENIAEFFREPWDCVVDAIDDVPAKIALLTYCNERGIPVISCMGTGNKMDPSRLCVADISKTHTCPLAKAIRKGLRERGIQKGVSVVFSDEEPNRAASDGTPGPSSNAFVPASAGLLMASAVIKMLLNEK